MEAAQVRAEGLMMTIKHFFTSSHAPTVYPTLPPLSLLNIFPPPSEPQVLPPPISDATLAKPFNISSEVYNNALHVSVPITFAIAYAVVARYVNRVNTQRNNKPWAFSKTYTFYILVLLHNLFLAVFSAWTFLGMIRAIRHTWPGWDGEHKLARAADALCKLHGPRGYGSAATFNGLKNAWGFTDRVMKLDQDLPDTTDVGRLWNEGLAFYGWLFYLSKFYEVVDTFIILAKGKNSAFFQTYHHAGAMFCVWSGIRYMSPPIWMFVIVNSGIHTLMYTYYALNHLGIRVSQSAKSTLTTMQITQFVFGATYALAHLFVAYDIPVETPYLFRNFSSVLPTAASSVSSAIASATASADIGSWLKKAALRAAGEEGLAENVRNTQGQAFGIDAVHASQVEKAREEIRYRTHYRKINCLDTPGETFAILLNFFYLAPLTVMFINFFIRTYLKNARGSPPPSTTENVEQSGRKAAKDLKQELAEAMSTEQNDLETEGSDIPPKVSARAEKINKGTEDLSHKAQDTAHEANDALQTKLQNVTDDLGPKAKDVAHQANDALHNNLQKATDAAHQANDILQNNLQKATDAASEKVNEQNRKWHEHQTKAEENETERSKQQDSGRNASEHASGTPSSEAPPEDASKKPQDDAPKLEPTPSSTDSSGKKPQSRSVSPQKKTKLPRPQSKNRSISPGKRDPPPKEEEKPQVNGDVNARQGLEDKPNGEQNDEPMGAPSEEAKDESKDEPRADPSEESDAQPKDDKEGDAKPSSLDESAYEINPDELKDEDEKKAEAEMQPTLE